MAVQARRGPSNARPSSPRFSLVIPVYNVAAFLPDFLSSLTAQTLAPSDRELIFINDGSTDQSADLICSWLARNPDNAILISQQNQGLAAARNLGISHAQGTWVTFPDPDDVLDPEYLARIGAFIDDAPLPPDLVCGHVFLLDDATGDVSDSHPLRHKFRSGTQLVNMARSPEFIHLQSASGFYRLERLKDLGLWFDSCVRPNFEDAYLTTLYLLESAQPLLGIVADAHYYYRRRADGSSMVQRSWRKQEKYTELPARGYLGLLQEIDRRLGHVPTWAQNTVLYDLLFYFRHDQSMHGPTGGLPIAWTEEFHGLVEQIFRLIETRTIETFSVTPTSEQLRLALIAGYQRTRLLPSIIPLIGSTGIAELSKFATFSAANCRGRPTRWMARWSSPHTTRCAT